MWAWRSVSIVESYCGAVQEADFWEQPRDQSKVESKTLHWQGGKRSRASTTIKQHAPYSLVPLLSPESFSFPVLQPIPHIVLGYSGNDEADESSWHCCASHGGDQGTLGSHVRAVSLIPCASDTFFACIYVRWPASHPTDWTRYEVPSRVSYRHADRFTCTMPY